MRTCHILNNSCIVKKLLLRLVLGLLYFVCRANMLLLVKCYDNKKIKSPYNWVISPLTQPEVANQQKK